MDASRFWTNSLRSFSKGSSVTRVLAAAIDAVEPENVVSSKLKRIGDTLAIDDWSVDLNRCSRILLIGIGKAAAPMAMATQRIIHDRLTQGIIMTKEGYSRGHEHFDKTIIHEAGHPIPDQRGIAGTGQIIDLLKDTGPEDLVIILISGGGSALFVSPHEGISLSDLQDLTSTLLASGANINEINTLRKHLDRVKGGQLARLAAPSRVLTLVLSDVVGDPLHVIASGPTVPDPSTFEQSLEILYKYDIVDKVPEGIVQVLERGHKGEISETPKPGDPLFEKVHHVIIGNNQLAAHAALKQATIEGFRALLLTTYLQGEARQVGRVLAALARQLDQHDEPLRKPACLILGGETTVTLMGDGSGGRNQEMALAAVLDMANLDRVMLVTLATDGGDGPTDAAGAVVTGSTLELADLAGLKPDDFLSRNDSYHFFKSLGDLIITGPTFTNVNDLAFLFAL